MNIWLVGAKLFHAHRRTEGPKNDPVST